MMWRSFYWQRLLINLGLKPRQKELLRKARQIYPFIVAQARQEGLYRHFLVEDTKEGRFEMLGLHLFLVYERLRQEPCEHSGDEIAQIGEFLSEVAVADLEQNLRHMGVGDLAVGRRVQKMIKQQYARLMMYQDLFGSGLKDNAGEMLANYVYANSKGIAPLHSFCSAQKLCGYITENLAQLRTQNIEDFLQQPNFSSVKATS